MGNHKHDKEESHLWLVASRELPQLASEVDYWIVFHGLHYDDLFYKIMCFETHYIWVSKKATQRPCDS
jgi:hypothetical protein